MKRFIPLVVMLAFMLIALMYNSVFIKDKALQINVLQEDLRLKENDYTVKKSSLTAENQIIIEQATGLVETRKAADDKIAMTFISDVVSWSSYAEYMEKKETLSAKYELDEAFLQQFFPPVIVTTAADGTPYNRIDAYDLSLTLTAIESYVTYINTDSTVYTYFTVCEVANLSNGGEGYAYFTITYTIDATGKISEIKGIL